MKNGINKWLTIISILLLVANAVTLTLLWSNKERHHRDEVNSQLPPPQGQAFEYITRELSLTKTQQDAYRVLRDEHQAAQRILQDSIRLAKDAFFELLKSAAVNDSVLQAASNKGLVFQQQLELVTFKHFQKVRAICTPEQQKRFDEIIKQVLLQMTGPRMRPPGTPPGEEKENDSGNIKLPVNKGVKAADDKMPPPPPGPGMRREGPPPPPGKWGRRPPPPGDMPPPPPGEGPPPGRNI